MKLEKTIIACDSFKGCLTSMEVGESCREAITDTLPGCAATVLPIADGGEGTVAALTPALGLQEVRCHVFDPVGSEITASYGMTPDCQLAVIETAAAAGLTLLSAEDRDPSHADTFGVGQLMLDAARRGASEIWIGLGGSATCDGGVGMLEAIGVKFYDNSGTLIRNLCGARLGSVDKIDASGIYPALKRCRIRCICDVDNPFTGASGAARVFAPQKGASPEMTEALELAMIHFEKVILSTLAKGNHMEISRVSLQSNGERCGECLIDLPGAGAAGGLGGALAAFLNAELTPGVDLILDHLDFLKLAVGADLVITGEGRLDSQTGRGKVPAGIIAKLRENPLTAHIPVVAIAGEVADGADVDKLGLLAALPIQQGPIALAEAMRPETARRNIRITVCQMLRLLNR